MKILKKPDTTWSYKHTCKQCAAELEVEKGDVKYTHHSGDYRDPSYETWQATCPVCTSIFEIPCNIIPKIIQLEIKKGLPAAGISYRD